MSGHTRDKQSASASPQGTGTAAVRPGTLYVVATPIGNLADLGQRAVEVLAGVDVIAAEDTRHTATLLRHYGITTPARPCHDFNERRVADDLLERLARGESVALVSDAGTPLISDPGYPLVSRAHERGIPVVPVPGPSAVMAALSACGLPVERFCFEGYLPERSAARRKLLEQLAAETRTLVFFETPHRIHASLEDLEQVLGSERRAAVARELTKRFETVVQGSLAKLRHWLEADADHARGEFVLVVGGAGAAPPETAVDERRLLIALLEKLSSRDAAAVAAKALGRSRNDMYRLALELSDDLKKPRS